jgi:hypothetical protein
MYAANREHPFSDDAITKARAVLGIDVPISTLKQWQIAYAERALAVLPKRDDSAVVTGAYNAVLTNMAGIQAKVLGILNSDEKLNKAGVRELAILLGILYDKLERAAGIPPSTAIAIKRLQAICDSVGWNVDEILEDMILATQERLGIAQPKRGTLSAGESGAGVPEPS